MNSYTVNEAIWLAAASYAYVQFKTKDKVSISDFYMKAAELANNAKVFTTNDVQLARIHQHCNGDHTNCSNKFLRRIEETTGNPVFRVAAAGEFGGDKERPDGMDPASELEFEGLTFSIGDLISFVEGDYKQIVSDQTSYKLYTIEEIRNRLVEIGFTIKNVASDMVQIGDKRTTIHRTADRGIILYATEEDFENISEDLGLKENIYVLNARSKDTIQEIIDKEQENTQKILCFPDGNMILHPSSAANYNADEIIMYSAENFRKVFKILTGYEFEKGTTEIDYLGILDYLVNNREVPYADPEKDGLSEEQRQQYLMVKKKGQDIVVELKKIYELCKKNFSLDKCEKVSWDDGSHQKTRKYLWVPMKYSKYAERHESISVFVDMETDTKAVFRVSLELRNDKTKADDVKKYHRHLELPLNEDAHLVYVSGSNELGRPEKLHEAQSVIKEKVEQKKYDKVQICRYIDSDEFDTNEKIEVAILDAVKALLPYYEYVLNDTDGYGPLLSEYDPGITAGDYESIFKNPALVNESWLDVLYYLYKMGGEGSCKQIVNKYGNKAAHYNTNSINIAKAVAKETGCKLSVRDTGEKMYWPVLFFGKDIEGKKDEGIFSYKLREPVMEAIKILDEEGVFQDMGKETFEEFDKNLILYGPPGTGKTYNSAIYAVAICDRKPVEELTDYSQVMERYNELKKEGRVAFTTFHQSYGYEEFIEGIKPVISDDEGGSVEYDIADGVFKRFCERACTPEDIDVNFDAKVWFVRIKNTTGKDLKADCFANGYIRLNGEKENTDDWLINHLNKMHEGDYIVSYLDHSRNIDAIGVISDDEPYYDDSLQEYCWCRKVNWIATGINLDIYELNGNTYLPNFEVAELKKTKVVELVNLFNASSHVAPTEANSEPYVFVIDEINRGNISKIFGELITLIEDSKRKGMPEAATAILPYSGCEFSVPSNVYILGTMNTADRSIALMDTALRRRFQFIEKMPDADVMRENDADKVSYKDEVLDVAAMLEIINDRISYLFDREHTIGHAFFMGLKEDPSIDKLASIFEKSIIPLLQEYFYEDYQKIQLVLGDNAKTNDDEKFIKDSKVELKKLFAGNVEDIVDEQEVRYEINKEAFKNIKAYKGIAPGL